MIRPTKFWRLDWLEQRLLVRAGLLLLSSEARLRWTPFRSVLAWAGETRAKRALATDITPERIAYLIDVAAANTYLVGNLGGWLEPTCLRKSLVLCRILCQCGFNARLVIGTGSVSGSFAAHAWVELNGKKLSREVLTTDYRELAAFGNEQAGQIA